MNLSKKKINLKEIKAQSNAIKIYKDLKDYRMNVYNFSDQHDDSAAHDKKAMRETIDRMLADKYGMVLHAGDWGDKYRHTIRTAKLKLFSNDFEEPIQQTKEIVEMLKPRIDIWQELKRMAYGFLGAIAGNHFEWMFFSDGKHGVRIVNSIQYMCEQTGVPYLGEMVGILKLCFNVGGGSTISMPIVVDHTKKYCSSDAADVNALEDLLDEYSFADLVLAGHTHRKTFKKKLYPHPLFARGKIIQKVRCAIRGGSYLKTYMENQSTYSERNSYNMLETGTPRVDVRFRKSDGDMFIKSMEVRL